MPEPSNTDLALQIGELRGELRGYVLAQQARDLDYGRRLDEAASDRRDLHLRLDRLTAWQNRITGALVLADAGIAVWVAWYHH